MKKKIALITGITGQDGSYLTDLLLSKDYIVHGLIRRSSSFNTNRIEHLYQDPHEENPRLLLHFGDMLDASSLNRLVRSIAPDEVYNLAAQSHVKVSFEQPIYTAEVVGIGFLNLLEAVRDAQDATGKRIKVYQASSSEMFGSSPPPQNEMTVFKPRSPYACAKVFAFNQGVNYREAYDMFVCNGILYNHETVTAKMPMFYKYGNSEQFNIKPISEIVSEQVNEQGQKIVDQSVPLYQGGMVTRDLQVWDKGGWTKVKYASGYPHNVKKEQKNPRIINARKSVVEATGSHIFIMADGKEKAAENIEVGDSISILDFPKPQVKDIYSIEEATVIGYLAADGYVSSNGRSAKFTNKHPEVRQRFIDLWKALGGSTNYQPSRSGFTGEVVGQLQLSKKSSWLANLDLYNEEVTPFGHRTKRVPVGILNGSPQIQKAFLDAYNEGDGLKANKCTYTYKNFKTNSATLALGLIYLVDRITGQNYNITIEITEKWGRKQTYYSIDFHSDKSNSAQKAQLVKDCTEQGKSQRAIARDTGISRTFVRKVIRGYAPTGIHRLSEPSNVVKKIADIPEYDGWFYDLETESGTFHCGVGQGHVHNSPRRGETFVSRKITRAATRIKLGLQKKLYLGNLEALRDWGYAKEYMEAAWLMMQQDNPDDYVIGTGISNSVKDFRDICFEYLELDPEQYCEFDPKYMRPSEVHALAADCTKAEKNLSWKPKTTFKELVKLMVDADLELAKQEKTILNSKGLQAK